MGSLSRIRARGGGPRPRSNGSDVGPLRKVISSRRVGKYCLEMYECGHEREAKRDLMGYTNATRRRCRACKTEAKKLPDALALAQLRVTCSRMDPTTLNPHDRLRMIAFCAFHAKLSSLRKDLDHKGIDQQVTIILFDRAHVPAPPGQTVMPFTLIDDAGQHLEHEAWILVLRSDDVAARWCDTMPDVAATLAQTKTTCVVILGFAPDAGVITVTEPAFDPDAAPAPL